MTLAYIFSKSYLFDFTPTTKSKLYIPLLILFSVMLLLSAGISLQRTEFKNFTKRFFIPLLATSILGFIYLFARYESLPYLSSRFFLALILFIFLLWTVIQLVILILTMPKEIKKSRSEERYQKYLPKNKLKKRKINY